jgi:hypothetical protein
MDPYSQGWLRNFYEKIDVGSLEKQPFNLPGYEQTLYQMIQPSGIMYGHPVKEIGPSELLSDHLDPVGRMKLIFAESLIRTGNLRLEAGNLPVNKNQVVDYLVPEISDYYLSLYPEIYRGKSSSYLQNPYYLAETLISKRVAVNTSLVKNYLANLFHNSLLFLDVFYFGEWVKGLGAVSSKKLRDEKAYIRLAILGVMALAANADKILQKEEKALFEFYLKSAGLNRELEKEARLLLNNFGKLDEVEIPQIEHWVLRKYLLEMAILVTLADREINESEHQFIGELGSKLSFSEDEVSASLLAVEGFVINNWSAMHYLVGRHDLERISSRFMVRLKGFVIKNKEYVIQEIRESKELFHLLGKSRTNTLTDIEKKIVNQQLVDILKTIPAFIIIALPLTFITLPTLLAILPKSAFPSSFQE